MYSPWPSLRRALGSFVLDVMVAAYESLSAAGCFLLHIGTIISRYLLIVEAAFGNSLTFAFCVLGLITFLLVALQ